MKSISKGDLEYLEDLSKLKVSKRNFKQFKLQLSEILNYVSSLSKVKTENVEATNQTTGLENVFRDDAVKKDAALSQKQALSGSKSKIQGYFKVSRILEERTDY